MLFRILFLSHRPFSDQVKNLAMTLSSAQLCRANEEAKQKEGSPYNTLVIDRSHSVDTFNEVRTRLISYLPQYRWFVSCDNGLS